MISPFIRAHGYIPGPADRPMTAGVLAGTVAVIPFVLAAWVGGGVSRAADVMEVSPLLLLAANGILMVGGGALYGWIFMRAANDRCGGWLFGASYGFVTWMVGPATIGQVMTGRPVVVGTAAQFLFAAHLAYGLALGWLYPYTDAFVRRKSAPIT